MAVKYPPILLLFLVACGGPPVKHPMGGLAPRPVFAMPDSLRIARLVAAIEECPRVEEAHVGFTGKPSEIYSSYAALLRVAPDSVWRKLTVSKKPVMRYYAFRALMEKKDPGLPQVIARLEKDKASVDVVSGCVEMGSPLCLLVALDSRDTVFLRKWLPKSKQL